MSTFTHAGVSKLDGKFKMRFCNDALRTKVLIKNDHTDIDIIELTHAMSKEAAATFLLSIDFDNGNAEVRAALEAEVGKRAPKAEKAPKAVKKVVAKPTLKSIAAKAPKVKAVKAPVVDTSEMEDAPF
jgi:hypothetical protein